MSQHTKFKIIDGALESYHIRNGDLHYINKQGNGRFLEYIMNEQLDDVELPIADELGDAADPNDCAYTWFTNNCDNRFPIPTNMQIPDTNVELFIFYLLQYIYKHNAAPTDQYIKRKILPQVDGTYHSGLKTTCSDSSVTKTSKRQKTKPISENNTTNKFITPYESKEGATTNSELEGNENHISNLIKPADVKIISKKVFKPEYAARAHLNIYTGKELIKQLLDRVDEPFNTSLNLYYYTDISAALQMNDKQINLFEIMYNDTHSTHVFGIIHYDLHCKDSAMDLYGIIIANDNAKKQQNKWLWKLNEFITATEIQQKYGISAAELPQSSRNMPRFKKELNALLVIEERIIDETDWFKIPQIKSLKRNIELPKVSITLTKELWIKECSLSLRNNNFPLIPVVVNKNNNHWIEWLKILYIASQNIYIGITFKYNEINNKLSVESICLDKGDIYNKHRLVGLYNDKYVAQLRDFKMSITEIIFSDNTENGMDKKMTALKQQITSQQNSIVRLKESIQKVNNKRKKNCHMNMNMKHSNNYSHHAMVSIEDEIRQMVDENDMIENENSDDFVSQIVDDVIKKYDVFEFKTNPIGVRQSIYINKELARVWSNGIEQVFKNIEEMYNYFDAVSAIQMIHRYATRYVCRQSKQFIVAIINYELNDFNGNTLYGIITQQNDTKYRYKLVALMNQQQIYANYGINGYDLPHKARKHTNYINRLLLLRKIGKQDVNQIKWSNLKIYKAQAIHNCNDPTNKSITITRNVMSEYTNISLQRVNNNPNKSNRNLIPILVIDKYNQDYHIEWILIIQIIHRNCPIGVAFKYNKNRDLFEATSIYLDKSEIETKHKLVGLKNDYCKHIRYFSLKRLKFKSNKDTVIDDDDDIAMYNNNNNCGSGSVNINAEKQKYKQLLENEKLKVQQLQQQLVQQQMQNQQLVNSQMYQYPVYNNNNMNNMNAYAFNGY